MKLKYVRWPHPFTRNHWIGSVLALVVFLAFIGATMLLRDDSPKNGEQTIEGEIICLPHKDTSGPQTLECAYGVKLADGTHYGLRDSGTAYENVSGLPTGKKARLTGTLKLESSDRYQSVGTFTVTNSEVVD
jgi:hypothetical protein